MFPLELSWGCPAKSCQAQGVQFSTFMKTDPLYIHSGGDCAWLSIRVQTKCFCFNIKGNIFIPLGMALSWSKRKISQVKWIHHFGNAWDIQYQFNTYLLIPDARPPNICEGKKFLCHHNKQFFSWIDINYILYELTLQDHF